MALSIGPHNLTAPVLLAPMAGVSDRPFRSLCRRFGAAAAPSEMVSASSALRHHPKTRRRTLLAGEAPPRIVQLLGVDPETLADAARFNVDQGAQIIDINMGCPAKKVCQTLAGSALLRDEALVGRILEAVVGAVAVPVTLKIRTGWSPQERNGVAIARIAAAAGIQALAVHGRTRACGFKGRAEYQTIRAIVASVDLPVVANGDIDSPDKAASVLATTGAAAVMVGRAATGQPWLFRDLRARLLGLPPPPPLTPFQVGETVVEHLEALYAFYGAAAGVRIARKHLRSYCRPYPGAADFWQQVCGVDDPAHQLALTKAYFHRLAPDAAA